MDLLNPVTSPQQVMKNFVPESAIALTYPNPINAIQSETATLP